MRSIDEVFEENIYPNPNPDVIDYRNPENSDNESKYEIPVMFREKGGAVRVIRFSTIYIPDTEKQKNTLRLFN